MTVETRYTYQNHHHKHQFVDGEELTALQQPGGGKSGEKVSQVININKWCQSWKSPTNFEGKTEHLKVKILLLVVIYLQAIR